MLPGALRTGLLLGLLLLSLSSCQQLRRYFASCSSASECQSGLCHRGVCTISCQTDGECSGGVCIDQTCQPAVTATDGGPNQGETTQSTVDAGQTDIGADTDSDATDAVDTLADSGDAGSVADGGAQDLGEPAETFVDADDAQTLEVAQAEVIADVGGSGCNAQTGPFDPPICTETQAKINPAAGEPGGACKVDGDCPTTGKCMNLFGTLACAYKACCTQGGLQCPGGVTTSDSLLCDHVNGCEDWQSNPSPKPGEPLAACGGSADCSSGKCTTLNGSSVCAGPCGTLGTGCCPVGWKCDMFGTKLCLPPASQ